MKLAGRRVAQQKDAKSCWTAKSNEPSAHLVLTPGIGPAGRCDSMGDSGRRKNRQDEKVTFFFQGGVGRGGRER